MLNQNPTSVHRINPTSPATLFKLLLSIKAQYPETAIILTLHSPIYDIGEGTAYYDVLRFFIKGQDDDLDISLMILQQSSAGTLVLAAALSPSKRFCSKGTYAQWRSGNYYYGTMQEMSDREAADLIAKRDYVAIMTKAYNMDEDEIDSMDADATFWNHSDMESSCGFSLVEDSPYYALPSKPLELSPVKVVVLEDGVCSRTVAAAIDDLDYWNANGSPDTTILIQTYGGCVTSALSLIAAIDRYKGNVVGICIGYAMSAGGLILSACTEKMRYAFPNATIMIHQPRGGTDEAGLDTYKYLTELTTTMLANNIGRPVQEMEAILKKDAYFNPSEAVDLGIIDGIIGE